MHLRTHQMKRSLVLLGAIVLLMASMRSSTAAALLSTQPEPILPAFGGLSDGGPVLSPYIDRLAFNARVDFLFLADTPERQQAFSIPYGFSLALLHLVEGGIYTRHTFWKEGEQSYSYNAPLGLNLKVRLWPWSSKDPNQHFTVVAAYQHEVRTGPFDGPNQLGLLTDLAALRIAASWPVWVFDIGGSVGVLYDYQGRFAVGELGARLSMRLDFLSLEATRASIEGVIRGLPTYVQRDADLTGAVDPQNPIRPSGALFLGINTRMTRTADFGLWGQKGFGDVASLSFGVRVLGIFIGEGYLRPRPIWTEVVKEIGIWIREQFAAIDPKFRQDCIAYDEDGKHTPMGAYGRLSDDGKFCLKDGYRVPVGVDLFRNKKGTLLCRDDKLRDCLLHRENAQAPWTAIHRPRLDADCVLKDSDGSFLERIGDPVGDGKTCHWRAKDQHGHWVDREMEIGRLYHADSELHRICFNEDLSGCFVERSDHGTRWTGLQQASANLGLGLEDGHGALKKAVDTTADVASGKIALKPIAHEAAEVAEHSIERCGSEGAACAKRVFNAILRAGSKALDEAKAWMEKPSQDKVNDAMRATGKSAVTTSIDVGVGIATGGAGQVVSGVVEQQLEKIAARTAAHRAEQAGKAIAKIVKKGEQVAEEVQHTSAKLGTKAVEAASHDASPYGHLQAPRRIEPGKDPTRMQKREMRAANRQRNSGELVDDETGEVLSMPKQSAKGATPPPTEAHIDHMLPKAEGGTNEYSNLRVISRQRNLEKGSKVQP